MRFKKLDYNLVVTFLTFLTFLTFDTFAQDQESDQQISEFSVTSYGEKGKKSWDVSGKSADIFTEVVKLKDVVGNLYGKEEDIKVTADKGDFNKLDGKVHLEQNVVVTTSEGEKLTTDSLEWDRKKQLVSTKDAVNIERQNMIAKALGAFGQVDLNKVTLEKDVKVDIDSAQEQDHTSVDKEGTIITCDGPLEIDYKKNMASFNNNVKVKRPDSEIYSDKMDIYFITSKDTDDSSKPAGISATSIEKIVARGNVKIMRGDNISYSEEATYIATDKKIVLSGAPKLIIYSTEEFKNASSGD